MTFLERVRQKRQKLADVLYDDDYSGIREIVEELYPDRAHFISFSRWLISIQPRGSPGEQYPGERSLLSKHTDSTSYPLISRNTL